MSRLGQRYSLHLIYNFLIATLRYITWGVVQAPGTGGGADAGISCSRCSNCAGGRDVHAPNKSSRSNYRTYLEFVRLSHRGRAIHTL